ncbi:hypothetical protein PYCCODRAFT_1440785 [Trametes coccinea BRFM310]|uniref:Small ribosomal subunit protein bS18m n=1 Tax=Trametes coccinea (strain BRFM310) TaxID=1353009 RepID=A0A1Y2I6Q0_TRAC3|nr:hypothetical protein PYCCODRAFT_1440785 [Trametes coccinea BRFM310]
MLSFVNSFRAAARRQPARLPAVRAVSSASAPAVQVEINTMNDMSQFVEESADDAIDTGPAEEIRIENGIMEHVGRPTVVPGSSRGFPVLKGFAPNQFVQPRSFSRDVYNRNARTSKRPMLGPDASTSRYLDVFHQLDIDPLKECQNSTLLSHFVTSMGKIKGRNETNLTWKNQRRIGKAIRRAKMMGIIPLLSRRTLLMNGGRF